MTVDLPVLNESRGNFSELRNASVLIYWPHGLGDWVHLSTILPLLEPSNRYYITRFGDDYVSIMDRNDYAFPIYTGHRAISDGSETGARHLGLDHRRINGKVKPVTLPPPLAEAFRQHHFDAVLYTDYPETEGRTAFPFHTKVRSLAKHLVGRDRLTQFDLTKPLRPTINFAVPNEVSTYLDERLVELNSPNRICLLASSGHTYARKHWPLAEARKLIALLHARNEHWKVLVVEDAPSTEPLPDGAQSFATLFADAPFPFGLLLKALVARSSLLVGIPAGPFHVAVAFGDLPVVGIWQAHHPDWYDEPNPNVRHLIGHDVVRRGFTRGPAVTTKPDSMKDHCEIVETEIVPAERVLANIDALMHR